MNKRKALVLLPFLLACLGVYTLAFRTPDTTLPTDTSETQVEMAQKIKLADLEINFEEATECVEGAFCKNQSWCGTGDCSNNACVCEGGGCVEGAECEVQEDCGEGDCSQSSGCICE